LYNKMIHPLFQIPVKGILWYQGESNAYSEEDAENYRSQFAGLIKDWRNSWNNPNMPFYWVQLANFVSGSEKWPFLREAQTATLAVKHTGQAITIDIGNPKDIHPRDKKTVGERLARIALNQTYGKNKVHFRGPIVQSASIKKDQLIVKFKTAKSLSVRDGHGVVKGFEIADSSGQFKAVTGTIKGNSVILPLANTTKPTAVRYAWSDNPEEANLKDSEGLPAEPFRKYF
jgi:sialate O-acetylesterase